MTRKTVIRTIATIFIASGLWHIGVFFWSFQKAISLNDIILGILLFRAGVSLYELSEFGRKLAFVLLLILVTLNILIVALSLTQEHFSFTVRFFGASLLHSENGCLLILMQLSWLLPALFALVFLLQRETKDIFLLNK